MFSILALTDGLMDTWSREHPERQVSIGDKIVEVNSARGGRRMYREFAMLRNDQTLRMTIVKAS